MITVPYRFSAWAAALLLVSPAVATADNHAAANLAETWIVTPKPGHSAEFTAAFKEHLELRESKKDPKVWKTYSPVIGDDLSYYVIRTCCGTWADVDSYRAWSEKAGVGEHWAENVDQHVADYQHYFSELDFENSHWPEDDAEYNYFSVRTFHLKPGHSRARNAAKAALSGHAKAGEWGRYWSWSDRIGGEPAMMVVVPYRNYAEMAALDKDLFATIAMQAGSPEKAAALFQSFNDTTAGSTYSVYRLLSDMSMKDR